LKQQENEREKQAVAALRSAVEADPDQLDAWLALSVSYTNESRPELAFDSLRQWLRHNPKYSQMESAAGQSQNSFKDVSGMFLQAAMREGELDSDVQIGLGVLFNVSEEYEKAVDCFQAALSQRPHDYMLWNKLGATLANSSDASRAMDSYFHALSINPSFIRARYNLAISCINMGQHKEAAHHLLEALRIQSIPGKVTSGFMSDNVWETLKMASLLLNRSDWAQFCDHRNLTALLEGFEALE
jgi:peroxin-5